jgi:hypothetical protein
MMRSLFMAIGKTLTKAFGFVTANQKSDRRISTGHFIKLCQKMALI